MTTKNRILILAAALVGFAMASAEAQDKKESPGKSSAPPAAVGSKPADAAAKERARKRNEELERVRKAQEAQQAATDASKKSEAQEARKRAAFERAREQTREEQERQAQCVIKPVMSDADIAKCREVRRGD